MKDIYKLIQSDYYRYKGRNGNFIQIVFYLLFSSNSGFKYCFWLRLLNKKNLLFPLALLMHRHLGIKYCIDIPRNTKIGYGLYLGHGKCIIINGGTTIGNNVNLSQFLNIGTNQGTPATIGDNVYIGPHVCIVEDVHIGDNSTIGAGAVVVKDVPCDSTVAGVPAKILSYNNPGRFIGNRFSLK